MKKIIIAAAVIFTTGILSVRTKSTSVQPTYAMIQKSVFDCKKELASGD
jgi:hypothetical protein